MIARKTAVLSPSSDDVYLSGPGFALGLCLLAEGPQAGALSRIELLPGATVASDLSAPANLTPAQRVGLAQVESQFTAWLDDPGHCFKLRLAARGTPFQQRVWAAIAAIPCGQTRSYGQLAATLGSAARAVGQACGANPLPLVVPCHRVISASGRLGGFDGATQGALPVLKRWLLAREGVVLP